VDLFISIDPDQERLLNVQRELIEIFWLIANIGANSPVVILIASSGTSRSSPSM
jgi:hypothetical protein